MKVRATELANTLNVRCERKRELGGPSSVHGLQNWQVGAVVDYYVRVLNGEGQFSLDVLDLRRLSEDHLEL